MPKKKQILAAVNLDDTDLIRGMKQFLLAHSEYQLVVRLMWPGNPIDLRRLRELTRLTRPHGILTPIASEMQRMMGQAKVPIVNTSDGVATTAPSVAFDHDQMGRSAADHLLGLGLKNYAYAARRTGHYAERRWQGFSDALGRAGASCLLMDDRFPGHGEQDVSYEQMRDWLRILPKPVGIHVSYTVLAVYVLWACEELKLKIPEDVALLGGRDRPDLTTMWKPTISAFELPLQRVGYEAMSLLHRLIQGEAPPAGPALLAPGDLVQRDSTNVLTTRDRHVATIVRFIAENAHRPLVVKELLHHVPLSRSTLERRFSKLMGRSLHDEIIRVHIERAKQLLRRTFLPVGEIGLKSGFGNAAVFSSAFRAHVGMSPIEYRRRTTEF